MPPQGEVARQWFIPGEGIDRGVITADIQRYLGNDATVRPGVGTGEYQGVQGYWIKAYRNFTSAMIQDLRADSQRWRQEQRQNGVTDAYVESRTYNESNAGRIQRDGNSPQIDQYGAPVASRGQRGDGSRPVDSRRPVPDAIQIDTPPGRPPPNQGYGQQGYYPPDPRSQYPPDTSRYPVQGQGGRGYAPEQPMPDYGQPDGQGRYPINYGQPDRSGGYPPQNQGPPPGYIAQGGYYVPMTTYSQQSGMVATSGGPGYYDGQPPQPQRGPGQPNQRPPRPESYDQPNYSGGGAYPSPAQTIPDTSGQFANPPRGSGGYPPGQPGYGQYDNRPASGPTYPPYQQDPGYAPPQSGHGRQPPDSQSGRQSDRSGGRSSRR